MFSDCKLDKATLDLTNDEAYMWSWNGPHPLTQLAMIVAASYTKHE